MNLSDSCCRCMPGGGGYQGMKWHCLIRKYKSVWVSASIKLMRTCSQCLWPFTLAMLHWCSYLTVAVEPAEKGKLEEALFCRLSHLPVLIGVLPWVARNLSWSMSTVCGVPLNAIRHSALMCHCASVCTYSNMWPSVFYYLHTRLSCLRFLQAALNIKVSVLYFLIY